MAQDFLLPRLAAVLLNNLRVLGSAERPGPNRAALGPEAIAVMFAENRHIGIRQSLEH